MSEEPLVSILLPVRNGEPYLEAAIRSVFDQTYPHWDLLISENCSTDSSLATIEKFPDPRVKVFRQTESLNMAGNWDFLLQKATGKYALVLGSDDILGPTHLASRTELHAQNPSAWLSVGPFQIIDSQGEKIRTFDTEIRGRLSASDVLPLMWHANILNILAVFFTTEGVFRHKLHFRSDILLMDWRLWLDLLLLGDGLVGGADDTIFYRWHNESGTSKTRPTVWAYEASLAVVDFLEANKSALAEKGFPVDQICRDVTRGQWLIAQKEYRLGQTEGAKKAFALFRRYHSSVDLFKYAGAFAFTFLKGRSTP